MSYDRTAMMAELVDDEGFRAHPYRCTAGKLTIGIGTNIDPDGGGISRQQAEALAEVKLAEICREFDRRIPWWRDASEPRKRALLNMGYQLGTAGLMKFKRMLAAASRGDWDAAADEALDSRWAVQTQPSRVDRVTRFLRDG